MKKKIVIGVGILIPVVLIVFLVVGPLLLIRHYKQAYEAQSPQPEMNSFKARIFEDQQILVQYDLFRDSGGERDAGIFFAGLALKKKTELSEEIKDKLTKDWLSADVDLKNFDFSWMQDLHDFDTWSWEGALPPPPRTLHLADLPLPEHNILRWGKLRLLKGLRDDEMEGALKDVRHLARLSFTNDQLVGAMLTVSLLMAENNLLEAHPELKPSGWETIPPDHVMRAKRFFYGVVAFIDPRINNPELWSLTQKGPGRCLMVQEGISNYAVIRSELGGHYPYEINRFDKMVQETRQTCRDSIIYPLWDDFQWSPFMHIFGDAEKAGLARFLPRSREILVFIMMSVGSPNFLRQYHE